MVDRASVSVEAPTPTVVELLVKTVLVSNVTTNTVLEEPGAEEEIPSVVNTVDAPGVAVISVLVGKSVPNGPLIVDVEVRIEVSVVPKET